MCNFRLVLTFSHEIIRTGKGALGGREGGERRRSWRPAPVSRERNLKHGKKSKTIGSFKVVDGLRPRMQYARERRGEGEGKRVCSGEKVGEGGGVGEGWAGCCSSSRCHLVAVAGSKGDAGPVTSHHRCHRPPNHSFS